MHSRPRHRRIELPQGPRLDRVLPVTAARTPASLLLLADGRLPAGGHAHSGGIEEAVVRGWVCDLDSLRSFLQGRLWTAGLVSAALAAAAATGAHAWGDLDRAADARTSSPALRAASRRQGRQMLRAALATWGAGAPALLALGVAAPAEGPHLVLATGAAATAAGLQPVDVAVVVAHGSVAGPASAAVRLLGLDPLAVSGVLGRMTGDIDAVSAAALDAAGRSLDGGLDELPATAAPLLEIGAEWHASRGARLFAS